MRRPGEGEGTLHLYHRSIWWATGCDLELRASRCQCEQAEEEEVGFEVVFSLSRLPRGSRWRGGDGRKGRLKRSGRERRGLISAERYTIRRAPRPSRAREKGKRVWVYRVESEKKRGLGTKGVKSISSVVDHHAARCSLLAGHHRPLPTNPRSRMEPWQQHPMSVRSRSAASRASDGHPSAICHLLPLVLFLHWCTGALVQRDGAWDVLRWPASIGSIGSIGSAVYSGAR